jgi:CBS-domain-containing membrane protein
VLRFPEDRAAAIRARDLMTKEVVTLTPENNFETAFYLFERKNVSFLPVVLPPERKRVVGILKAEDLLAAHNQRVLKDRFLQLPPKGEQKSRGESWPDGR